MADYGLGSWPARRARIDGAAIAFRQDDRAVSYGELARRVEALTRALQELGVRAGDRVMFLARNDIAGFELCFAATHAGAMFTPINWRLARPEIEFLVADATPAVLVHGAEFAAVVDGLDVRPIELGAPFEQLITQGASLPTEPIDVGLDDPAIILYTSGTTGRPKGAVLTHGNVTFNTMNQLAHADVLSTDVALCISPLFHATGLGQVSLPTIFKGGTVIVVPAFDAGTALAAIATLRIASFAAVPTMLQLLAEHPAFDQADLSSLRYVIYGGSTVLKRVAVAWQRRGVVLQQGYGMTEASPGVTMAPVHGAAQRPVSIGVPHFFTDITVDPALDEAAPGSSGELLVRGPNVFRGYWNRPAETEAAFVDGWYRSGDVVRFADDGWAYLVDRVKDMIISGGENVYPAEVEAELVTLPGIEDCAVVAVPDEQWGEVGAAFIVSSDDQPWTPARLQAALAGRIAGYKIPKYVHDVPELPRTATGKIRKHELRALTDEIGHPAR